MGESRLERQIDTGRELGRPRGAHIEQFQSLRRANHMAGAVELR
jgi:hypothetical protein